MEKKVKRKFKHWQLTLRANSLQYSFNEFTKINEQFFIIDNEKLLKFNNVEI